MGGAVTLGPGCWVSDHRVLDVNDKDKDIPDNVRSEKHMPASYGTVDNVKRPQLLLLICTI